MTATDVARGMAIGRIALGALLTVSPRAAAAGWIGDAAAQPGTSVVARALGIRDAGLGAGVLASLGDRDEARGWLAACVAADAVDFAATMAVRNELPPLGRVGVPLLAGGSSLAGLALLNALD